MAKFKAGDIVFSKADPQTPLVVKRPCIKIFNQKYDVTWISAKGEFHNGEAWEVELYDN